MDGVEVSELDDYLANLANGTGTGWGNNVTYSLTLPSDALPGQPRIVIGSQLPPPLDTYVVAPWSRPFTSGIIFYAGTAGDDDYIFLAVVVQSAGFNGVNLTIGAVANGVLQERSPGVPGGLRLSMDTNSPLDVHFDLANFAGQLSRVSMGSGVPPVLTTDKQIAPMQSVDEIAWFIPAVGGVTLNVTGVYQLLGGSPLNIIVVNEAIRAVFYVQASAWSSVVGTAIEFGMRFNGTDYTVGQFLFNTAGEHHFFGGRFFIPGGVPAGSYQGRIIWRRTSGTGILTTDSADRWSYGFDEGGSL
jgi:hypothetical protein